MQIKNMNKALKESDFTKNENGLEWFDIEGATVTMCEQPVIKRKNVNFTYWHGGLLTGHTKFKFDGEGQVKIQTTEDLNEFTHLIEEYNGIIRILESHAWEVIDFKDFHKISTFDARPGFDFDYVRKFKTAINNDAAKNDLARFDKELVGLMLNNIVSENKMMKKIYSKWFK